MKNIKIIIAFILGIVVSGLGVYALSISARETSYDNSISGSPATNMQDAIDDLYEKAGNGSRPVLLWTNPDPSIEFTAQTISLDLSSYNAIIIFNSHSQKYQIFYKDDPQHMTSGGDDLQGYMRRVTPTDTGVSFGDGYYRRENPRSSDLNNIVCIPGRIYGVNISYPE